MPSTNVYEKNKEHYLRGSKEHYAKYKSDYLERGKRIRDRNNKIIREAKSGGCTRCDEKDVLCMDLHHRDPTEKDFTVSQMKTLKEETVRKEIAKCIVLCANCHRKVHAE